MTRQSSKDLKGTIVFDLETQKSLEEVGGRKNIRELLLSLAVVYRYSDRRYITFWEKDAVSLLKEISKAEQVVGFNLLGFDYEVLKKYGGVGRVSHKTVDMMKRCEEHLGFRPKLDDLVTATLGEKKGADGLRAICLYQQGRMKELEGYCKRDVELTHKLFEFGLNNGFVLIEQNRKGTKIPATW